MEMELLGKEPNLHLQRQRIQCIAEILLSAWEKDGSGDCSLYKYTVAVSLCFRLFFLVSRHLSMTFEAYFPLQISRRSKTLKMLQDFQINSGHLLVLW